MRALRFGRCGLEQLEPPPLCGASRGRDGGGRRLCVLYTPRGSQYLLCASLDVICLLQQPPILRVLSRAGCCNDETACFCLQRAGSELNLATFRPSIPVNNAAERGTSGTDTSYAAALFDQHVI